MTGDATTTELARGRTIRCTEEERARIEARAEAARMSVSAFVMACALQDDGVAAAAASRGQSLVLSADEQRDLVRAAARIEAGVRRWDGLLPGMEVSASEALATLVRLGMEPAGDGADSGT